jgi:hypothetical protein
MDVAIESTARRVHDGDLRGLRALTEDHQARRKTVISLESEPRTVTGGIEIVPWQHFVRALWAGEYGV